MPTAFDMFKDNFFRAGKVERQAQLNTILNKKLILEIVHGGYQPEYAGRMIKSLLELEQGKDTPDSETVAFAVKHLNAIFDRAILKGGSTETTKTIQFTESELDLIEKALKAYDK